MPLVSSRKLGATVVVVEEVVEVVVVGFVVVFSFGSLSLQQTPTPLLPEREQMDGKYLNKMGRSFKFKQVLMPSETSHPLTVE